MLSKVLLKNEHSRKPVLPLSLDQKVAVIGEACVLKVDVTDQEEVWTAGSYYGIGGTSRVLSPDDISILDGMRRYTENLVRSPTDLTGFARKAMQGSDVAVVCAGTTATESVDRRTLRLDQDALVGEVVRLGVELKVPVVVIALAPGAVVMPWSAEATGILMMFPSGQMTGLAAADLLFGARMPAGKLPLTIPQEESDALRPCAERNCPYQEQLFSGWLLYTSRDVAFPFGYGLSYTTFEYKPTKLLGPTEVGSVHVTIKNVGQKPGREIVQLYMRYPSSVPDIQEEPATQLRRFHRTRELQPGEAEDVVLKLSARDMSVKALVMVRDT
ncbi:Thermostable beta-glucosidase B (Beta-D-glucoside glucohydrolase) (Cellobiase) (Gentiobiase) [Durusdinium trenchii]|uniref:beta-glucosidase n=1 Tax=Durusdinium trenchii TaxID=1381693 RepID=A0ABP0QAY3_9DINO